MSDYLFCITRPDRPGYIEICSARDDPRQQTLEATLRRRAMGKFRLEWTLPVVDRALSEAALRKALHGYRERSAPDCFACAPMDARGIAVRLTTLRPDPKARSRRKPGFLRRLLRAA